MFNKRQYIKIMLLIFGYLLSICPFIYNCSFLVVSHGAITTYVQQEAWYTPTCNVSLRSYSVISPNVCVSMRDNRSVQAVPSADNATVAFNWYNSPGCQDTPANTTSFPTNTCQAFGTGFIQTTAAAAFQPPMFNSSSAQQISTFPGGTACTGTPSSVFIPNPMCHNTTSEIGHSSVVHGCNTTHLFTHLFSTDNCTGSFNETHLQTVECVNGTLYACSAPAINTTSTLTSGSSTGMSTGGNTTSPSSTGQLTSSSSTGKPTTSTSVASRMGPVSSALFAFVVCGAFAL
eukprot:Phypoly_transcript_14777.p1 GENE.Phypoly_transcript_14777~~Phypoly_transcript_14777.p1  ORF type:complete len:289 (+),score=50.36 Phypoly_transcript_14777:81-947(+)